MFQLILFSSERKFKQGAIEKRVGKSTAIRKELGGVHGNITHF